MKKLFLLLLSFGLLTAATDPPAQTVPVDICDGRNRSFLPGEQLTYKIYYNWNFVWIAAGEVTFSVSDEDDQYHLVADGRTYAAYDWAFKVRDRYDTYIDKETLLPTRAIRDLSEGKYTLYEDNTFDQANHSARTVRGRNKDNIKEDQQVKLDNCTHDIMSILYFTRNLQLDRYEPGNELPVEIYLDKEVYPLKVKYLGRESDKKVKGSGRFRTHKISPEVIAGGVFNEDAQMKIWVSDDANQIPVMIESPIKVGSVKVMLKEYSGLRYELDAAL